MAKSTGLAMVKPASHLWQMLSLTFSLSVFIHSLFLKFPYFWLHWVFIAAHRLSLVVVNRAYFLGTVCGFLIVAASPVQSMGSRPPGSMHGLSCSTTGGIFPDQGSNP